MSRLLVTSDLHLGHNNIHKYRGDKNFHSAEVHHEFVFNRLLNTVMPRDTVLFLGDIAFSPEWLQRVSNINCQKKVLVVGNHDTDNCSIFDIANAYDEVYSLWSHRGILYSHAPIHESELRGQFNVHGHTHGRNIDDSRYFNACLENTDYRPVEVNDIKLRLKASNPNAS